MNNDNYLAHHGIKGQKWGVRQYQNTDGSLTAEGRKRYGVGPERGSKEALKQKLKEQKKAYKEERKAAKKAQSEEEKHDATMKYLRDHPTKLYKYRNQISEADAKKLVSQIKFDRELKDIRDAEIQRGWNKVKSITDNANTVANLLANGTKIYNSTADIQRALVDAGKLNAKKMTKIGGGSGGDNNNNKDKKD